MTAEASQDVEICNRKGLHARASAALAREALKFKSKIVVSHEGVSADAASIMDLLMLTAHQGCRVNVSADGEDAEEAITAVVALISNKFGETE